MLKFLIYVSLFISGCLLCQYSQKLHLEGRFLNEKIKPYHREIASLVSPYQGTSFYTDVLSHSQIALKQLLAEYKNSREGEMSKTVVDSFTNRDIVHAFALMYIIWHKLGDICCNETSAILSLKDRCSSQLYQNIGDVPACFWSYFEMSPNALTEVIKLTSASNQKR